MAEGSGSLNGGLGVGERKVSRGWLVEKRCAGHVEGKCKVELSGGNIAWYDTDFGWQNDTVGAAKAVGNSSEDIIPNGADADDQSVFWWKSYSAVDQNRKMTDLCETFVVE